MRKSVEERLKHQQPPSPLNTPSFFRVHRLFLAIAAIVVVLGASSFAAVWWYGEKSLADAHTRAVASAKKADAMLAAVKQRIAEQKERERKARAAAEAKRKAEEAARKKREAESAAARQRQQATASATPANCGGSGPHRDPNSIDIIVNKKHCLVPLNYYPPDLITTSGGAVLRSVASQQFEALRSAAAQAGYTITATSSFRSYDNQVATYNHWVNVNGSYTAADRVSARPGYSEHQTGLTVDLAAPQCALECFGSSGTYIWMKRYAASYGFVERYPAGYEAVTGYNAESWHWRYVGPTTAQAIASSGVHTLEQYWGVSGGVY